MPLLAAWFGSLFASTVSFLALYITKRVAIVLVAIAAIIAMTASFIAAIEALLVGIAVATPAEISIAASWFIPSNATTCLSIILSAYLARWVYEWQIKIIQLKLI